MEFKTLHLPLLKAAGSSTASAAGVIVGYASVFGLRDLQGDIVTRGAFAASLAGWKAVKQTPALLWQHRPTAVCGLWEQLREDAIGLLVHGRLDLHTKRGIASWRAIQDSTVNGLSIGYRVTASHDDPARRARILTGIALEEISLVTVPANPAARVRQVPANPAARVTRIKSTTHPITHH